MTTKTSMKPTLGTTRPRHKALANADLLRVRGGDGSSTGGRQQLLATMILMG
jgi:hypothetical protein